MSKLITCQTVVSDPFLLWRLDAGAVAPEEEGPEEAFEPPPAREWQPDDVLSTSGGVLSTSHDGNE